MALNKYLKQLNSFVEQKYKDISVIGLSGSARAFFLSMFLLGQKRPCLILLPSQKEANRILKEIQFFMSESAHSDNQQVNRVTEFPAYDISPLTGFSPSPNIIAKRLEVLFRLLSQQNPVVVTSIEAIFPKILPKRSFINTLEPLEPGEEFDRDELIAKLETMGYHRTSLVEEISDYAVRGGVIDIFPPLHSMPVRLEFWGDHIESIRHFDPLSQRSLDSLEELVLIPASEVIRDEASIKRSRSMGRLPNNGANDFLFPGKEAWLKHFYEHLDTLFDYLPQGSLITLSDPHRILPAISKIHKNFINERAKFHNEASQKGLPFPDTEGTYISGEELSSILGKWQKIALSELDLGHKGQSQMILPIRTALPMDEPLEVTVQGHGKVSMAPLAEKVSEWKKAGATVVMVTRTEQQAGRLAQILENYGVAIDRKVEYWSEIGHGPCITICMGRITKGFIWPELGLYVISEDEIFGPKKARPHVRRTTKEPAIKWSSISHLNPGDLVVHEEHGIGKFQGLCKMEIGENENDFVLVEYADGDKLYIPAHRINILQKYIGADEGSPKLDRLGGRSWSVAKKRVKKSVKQIAKQLVDLYALRAHRKGFAFSPPDNQFREFEATFEHEETPDQTKAIEDVLKDMTSERPMDRLICGDVGFGKTEIAIRAAFKAVSDGKQVAMLVPTTVLAEQHYETFYKRMKPYGIEIALLSRFKTKKEQNLTLAGLRAGTIHIVIGTHRLLQDDVKFLDLGLLIIDEEHRFGVKQKEALKKYRSLVDVLALTATPIPRTLQLSMTGVRDLSIIETPPEDRYAIQTYLSPYDETLIIRAIEAELERGGQVFYVYNRVQTIEMVAQRLRELIPHASIAVGHGQMKEKELEKTMLSFLKKEIDVLVCSTIIESGLDIPSANTIIITEVDRLGLAQIYQLRGRVGRSKEHAYAYLLFSDGSKLSKDAEKRLKALMDFSHLGAGLRLAMHDLKIRGGGNILGFAQSGHIAAVGYELYIKLIEQAVAELKGEEWSHEIDPEINIRLMALLPESYISDTDIRLNLYRRLSMIKEHNQLLSMEEEIRDRFGPLPQEVKNLFELVGLRILLKKIGINKLDVGKAGITLSFSENTSIPPDKIVRLIDQQPNKFRLISDSRLYMRIPNKIEGNIKEIRRLIEAYLN